MYGRGWLHGVGRWCLSICSVSRRRNEGHFAAQQEEVGDQVRSRVDRSARGGGKIWGKIFLFFYFFFEMLASRHKQKQQ